MEGVLVRLTWLVVQILLEFWVHPRVDLLPLIPIWVEGRLRIPEKIKGQTKGLVLKDFINSSNSNNNNNTIKPKAS